MKKKSYTIIWEDEHLLVLNKAAGILSIPDRYDPEKPNLQSLLNRHYDQIWTVHRIDKDTSGLLCFAKTEAAHSSLSQQFAAHETKKIYLAITNGQLIKDEGIIEFKLAQNPMKKGRVVVAAKGKSAITTYRVAEKFATHSLLEVQIKTGRTHQIRVHLQAIGHPLLADPFYSPKPHFLLSSVKKKRYQKNKYAQERPLLSRTALHAFQLGLKHPETGEQLNFEAPLPKDMKAVVNQLRKWDK